MYEAPDRYKRMISARLPDGESLTFASREAEEASSPLRDAQLIAYAVAGVAEAAARMVLQDPDRWTPGELGERLAGLIWRGRSGL